MNIFDSLYVNVNQRYFSVTFKVQLRCRLITFSEKKNYRKRIVHECFLRVTPSGQIVQTKVF